MYITPYQKKQLTTVLLLVLGIPLTLFAIYKGVQWFTSAGADTQPHDVIIANLTTNSIAITWTTETKVTGSVIPVLNGTDQNPVIDKRGNDKLSTHFIELKGLEPSTKYDFKIISGSDTYTNLDGNEFTFTTANISTETPNPMPVYGEMTDINNDDALIYIFPKDKSTYPLATVPLENGNWLIGLSTLRKTSDNTLYTISETTNLLVIGVSSIESGGVVEGEYGKIFDSQGKLTEDLISVGDPYIGYVSDSSKLIAQEEEEEPITPEPDDKPVIDEKPYVPPVIEEDQEDETPFTRNFELKKDLIWLDLVSADGSISSEPDEYGQNTVMVTNLTDVSFSVIWYSQEKEAGYVMYGESSSNLTDKGRDERDGISSQGEYYLHSVEITQLKPETIYYFEVYSGSETYTNDGQTYEVTTFATQSSPPQFETIAGTMSVQDYQSALVIAVFSDEDGAGSSGESYPISTLVDSEGSWILTIGGARDENGGYFDKSDSDIVTFTPKYFTNPSSTELTIGEAKSSEVELTATSSSTSEFRIIPLLSDYGILSN
jgi:hypothetical protein